MRFLYLILLLLIVSCTMVSILDEPEKPQMLKDSNNTTIDSIFSSKDTTRLYPIEFSVEVEDWKDTDTTEVVI